MAETHEALWRIGLSSISAATAEMATFPIDIVKTRLQLDGERRRLRPSAAGAGVFRVASEIWGNVGFLGFYSEFSPAILRHIFYTPIRIVGYEHLRNFAGAGDSIVGKAISGGVSGVLAQVVASPADLIKVRMQSGNQLINQDLQPRYVGISDAVSKIIRTEGFPELWRGVFPNAQRAFLVNMGELACYDHAKRIVIRKHICEDNMFAQN